MNAAATPGDPLAPLRAEPSRAAILMDIDGTLAPIVRHATDAMVPEATRSVLIALTRRYAVVACVSGRRASDARRVVSIGTMTYVGSHGAEILRPGTVEPVVDPNLRPWIGRIQRFAGEAATPDLAKLRVRLEDKQTIVAFHWRGAPDEAAAEEAVHGVADRADAAGFATHWGRKVLEVRPPVPMDKGSGVRQLLRDHDVAAAMYVGDDATDLDAFRALGELVESGRLERAVRVGVASDEGPAAITAEADLVVDGTAGVHRLLSGLLDGGPGESGRQ
jgi:trehalose 6-phosphate phosphatase